MFIRLITKEFYPLHLYVHKNFHINIDKKVYLFHLNVHQNFAVTFLKMLALYMLWRAQFLSEFYVVFCVHQILILLKLLAKIWEHNVSQKVKILILLLAIILIKKKKKFCTLDYDGLNFEHL